MSKNVFSLFIDGNEVKFVWAKKIKDKIKLMSLERATLKSRIEEKEVVHHGEDSFEDTFGLQFDKNESNEIQSKDNENKNIFYNLLNKYPIEKGDITVNLLESNVGFISFSNNLEKTRSKIKGNIIEEINKIYTLNLKSEDVVLVPGNNGELVAVFQMSENPVLEVLNEIRPFLERRIRIALAEVNEIALVNLINRFYSFNEDEISAVIYIGIDFSRIFFMKGNKILSFVPIVNEGYGSDNILSRLYGKIILERDESSVLEFNNILLAGEAILINGLDFFKEKFPESTVEYISSKGLDISELEKSDIDNLSVYSIPISSALKILEPKNKQIIQTNFLPKKIKEQQKWFKIAWHGLIFLIALCSALLYFIGQYLVMERRISQVEYVTTLLDEQIVSGESILTKLHSIEKSINHYENNFVSYDSLTKNYDMVSVFLKNISNNIKSTNLIWLNSLDVMKSGYSMKGESIYKSRIPTFVSFYDDYVINNVTGTKVRDKEIFQYEITGNLK